MERFGLGFQGSFVATVAIEDLHCMHGLALHSDDCAL